MTRKFLTVTLAMTLSAVVAPAHAMTATVSSSSPPASAPSAAPKSGDATQAARADAMAPAQAMPNASALTKPANVLLAPDVPPKASSDKLGVSGKDKNLIVPPAQASPIAPVNAQWKRTANAETRMQRGAIQAISMERSTLEVHGEKLTFDAREVKVFARDGKPTNIYALKSGVPVRFAIDAKDNSKRRVTVIWVDN